MQLIFPCLLWTLGMFALLISINMVQTENMKIAHNRAVAVMGFSVTLWCCGYAVMVAIPAEHISWAYTARLFALFGIYIFLPTLVYFISSIAKLNRKFVVLSYLILLVLSLILAYFLSRPSVVSFSITDFGCLYHTNVNPARKVQTIHSITIFSLATICDIYVMRNKQKRRERINNVIYFFAGSCILIGMVFDTVLPMMGKTAFPMSGVGGFFALLILYYLAKYHSAFLISKINTAEYLYGCVDTPICIANGEDRVEIVTDENLDVLGLNKQELLNASWLDVLGVDEEVRNSYRDIMSTNESKKYGTIVFRWDSPKSAIYNVRVNVVYDKYGDSICTILVFTDMTNDLQMMEDLAKSKEEAEAANRAKSDFLANMSHEIRTPMNTILGMNEIILRETTEENVKQCANNVERSAESLLTIINDILDFSKIESGKLEIINNKYSFAKILNTISILFDKKAKEKGIELLFDVDPMIPATLIGDETRIQQILVNMVSNAIKYTHEGYVKVSVDYKKESSSLHVRVSDTGIGIKNSDLPKLFEAFERIEESRNRSIEGTGLGLSITLLLLKKMGSKLQVESEYGKGSTFFFVLYQQSASREAIGDFEEYLNNNSKETKAHRSTLKLPGISILVVDDNEMNLQVISGLLKHSQMDITTAQSGQKALELVQQHRYDIIFMDHMMPEMDGITTLHEMKNIAHKCEDTPVVALTANAISGAKEMYLAEGFYGYLTKPIMPEQLEESIVSILEDKGVDVASLCALQDDHHVSNHADQDAADHDTSKEQYTVGENRAVEEHDSTDEIVVSEKKMGTQTALCKLIDYNKALAYVAGDRDMAQMVIDLYCQEKEKRTKELNQYLEAQDYENYRIQAHSLKTTSFTVGADVAGKKAEEIELACKREDYDFVQEHHEEMLKLYADSVEEFETTDMEAMV